MATTARLRSRGEEARVELGTAEGAAHGNGQARPSIGARALVRGERGAGRALRNAQRAAMAARLQTKQEQMGRCEWHDTWGQKENARRGVTRKMA